MIAGSSWAGSYDSNGSLTAFSNWYNTYNSGQQNYLGNLEYQCVEFANRFADKLYGTGYIPNIASAKDFWAYPPSGWTKIPNGDSRTPQWGDLVIYKGASWNGGYGHVSIVSSVAGSTVVVVEQNWDEVTGQGTLSLSGYTLSRPADGVPSTDIYGWLRPPNPLPAPSGNQLAITSPALSGGVTTTATIGPITVVQEDPSGNPLNAGAGGVVVSLASTSASAVFAATRGGSPVTAVTIPNGSSSVGFYYGDSSPGRPVIRASGLQLTIGVQVEAVTPIVTALSVNQGPVAGGTSVTITGTGFTSASTALFGATQASVTTYVSSTQLAATSPAASSGVVDVAVSTNGAISPQSTADRFIYGSVSDYRGVSTRQYVLNGSDGATWQDVDSAKLSLSVVPPVTSVAVLSASSALFTGTGGYSQDLGISVSPSTGDCSQTPVVWRESGGATAYKPNAVSMQISCTFNVGTTYVVKLVWKANRSTSAHIYAGAGSGSYSPTVVSASLVPASGGPLVQTKSITTQKSRGAPNLSWDLIDSTNLVTTVSTTTTAMLSASADLFAVSNPNNANFDLGICVGSTPSTCPNTVVAWAEAGGGNASGAFQPTATALQYVYSVPAGYTVGLVWRATGTVTIYTGAGSGPYSPTVLLINAANNPTMASITSQPSGHYGTAWQGIDSGVAVTITPSQDEIAYVSFSADVFTNSITFNTDIGVCVYTMPSTGCDPEGNTITGWTEAAAGATFNPDGALMQIPVLLSAGKTYVLVMQWRTNTRMPSDSWMYSGAGSSAPFASTALVYWTVPLAGSLST